MEASKIIYEPHLAVARSCENLRGHVLDCSTECVRHLEKHRYNIKLP